MPTPKAEVGINQIYTKNKIYHLDQNLALLLAYFPSHQKGDISFRTEKLHVSQHIWKCKFSHSKYTKNKTKQQHLIISFTFAQYPWLIQCH